MKLLVVDDHPIVRDGLTALLAHVGPGTTVMQARDADEGLFMIDRHTDLDAIILDLMMPGMDGFQAIAVFGRKRPDLPVIVLSSSEDPADVRRALNSGALGYVAKSASQNTLLAAIRQVLGGDLYVPPFAVVKDTDAPLTTDSSPSRHDRPLTPRQIEILSLLSEGMPNKIIAAKLHLSEKTVKAHVTAIFKALNVVNRTQASVVARQAGLI
jgi:two-component system, NarL family, nitrate/nitrite response regulator NarL